MVSQASPPRCSVASRPSESASEPLKYHRIKRPATKRPAEARSWLRTTWPSSRAFCRRYGVASCVLSPKSSAAIDQGSGVRGRGSGSGSLIRRQECLPHRVDHPVELFLKHPGGGAEAEGEHAEDDQRIEVQADGDSVELRQRAADERDDEGGEQDRDHDRRGGADANFKTLRGDLGQSFDQAIRQSAVTGGHPRERTKQRIDCLSM